MSWLDATKGLPLLGHALAMARDPLALFLDLQREHGDVAPFRLGRVRGHLVSHPELVDQVMRKKAKHYSRMTPVYEAMTRFAGHGILTSEGEHWKRHRRIVQPAFHRQRLRAFADAMARVTAEHLERAVPGKEVDASDEMMRLTLKIVSETLLGTRTDRDAEDIGRAIDAAQRYVERVISGVFESSRVLPTPAQRRLARANVIMDRVAYRLIEEKRVRPGDDVISMLVQARYEDGTELPARQIRDEVLTLMAAGHETTANALSWTLALLSRHPGVRRNLEAEVDAVLGGRAPTLDDLPRLRYARWVFDETLRLRPPAWTTGRLCIETHELQADGTGRHTIPEGHVVLVSPWVTHHRADLWDNPMGFDPERWEALSQPGALHPFAYFPFGGGPRKCVGYEFAYIEATIVLAMIAQRRRFDLVPGHPVAYAPRITLGLKGGLRMRVTPRHPADREDQGRERLPATAAKPDDADADLDPLIRA
jgi:cytochrome P450